jgi:hypothetical protein
MLNKKKKIIYILGGIIILLTLYLLKNTNYFLRALAFIFSVILFYFSDVFFNLKFKNNHYFIFIFISTAGILFSPLYYISSNYDKILHLVSPFIISILIFFLINKTILKFSTKLLITFSVVVMFLSLFEMVEFLLDQLFDLKLQGVFIRDISGVSKLNIFMDKNDDTMIDLILGTISSAIFIGYKAIIHSLKNLQIKNTKL